MRHRPLAACVTRARRTAPGRRRRPPAPPVARRPRPSSSVWTGRAISSAVAWPRLSSRHALGEVCTRLGCDLRHQAVVDEAVCCASRASSKVSRATVAAAAPRRLDEPVADRPRRCRAPASRRRTEYDGRCPRARRRGWRRRRHAQWMAAARSWARAAARRAPGRLGLVEVSRPVAGQRSRAIRRAGALASASTWAISPARRCSGALQLGRLGTRGQRRPAARRRGCGCRSDGAQRRLTATVALMYACAGPRARSITRKNEMEGRR